MVRAKEILAALEQIDPESIVEFVNTTDSKIEPGECVGFASVRVYEDISYLTCEEQRDASWWENQNLEPPVIIEFSS